jgi:rfaE bifunctional protein nucleotidyltransferase chain/domain
VTSTESKILTYDACKSLTRLLRSGGFRMVVTNGCFDILHAGHVRFLEDAARRGDHLLVGVNADWAVAALKGPGRPVNTLSNRLYVLAGLSCVSYVVPVDSVRVVMFLRDMQAAVWVKGGDYTIDTLDQDEVAVAKALDTKIEILPVTPGLSTTSTLSQIKNGSRS